MSSATETIRSMLNERGVEWTEPNNKARSHTTYWTAGFLRCIAVEFNDGMVSIASSSDDITPEQAIEATLGKGECELPTTCIDHGHIEYNGVTDWRKCSGCGREILAYPANFCPNCGRSVKA